MFQKDTMMVRKRRIHRKCIATPGYYYKPLRIPLVNLEVISLSKEELTALYYADYMGVIQKLSAKKMAISQATFSRELSSARRKIAEALLFGKALKFESELSESLKKEINRDKNEDRNTSE